MSYNFLHRGALDELYLLRRINLTSVLSCGDQEFYFHKQNLVKATVFYLNFDGSYLVFSFFSYPFVAGPHISVLRNVFFEFSGINPQILLFFDFIILGNVSHQHFDFFFLLMKNFSKKKNLVSHIQVFRRVQAKSVNLDLRKIDQ